MVTTLEGVFSKVYVFQVKDKPLHRVQNVILVGAKQDVDLSQVLKGTEMAWVLDREVTELIEVEGQVLTDDFSPIEYYGLQGRY